MYSDFAWWKSATTVMIIYLLSIYKELFYSRGIIEFTIIKTIMLRINSQKLRGYNARGFDI